MATVRGVHIMAVEMLQLIVGLLDRLLRITATLLRRNHKLQFGSYGCLILVLAFTNLNVVK